MVARVRATPSQIVEIERTSTAIVDLGSYPEEITRDQFDWLQERAAERRRKWAEHARSLARNQKS